MCHRYIDYIRQMINLIKKNHVLQKTLIHKYSDGKKNPINNMLWFSIFLSCCFPLYESDHSTLFHDSL